SRPLRVFFVSSRRRHTRFSRDWSSDVCSSDLAAARTGAGPAPDRLVARGQALPRRHRRGREPRALRGPGGAQHRGLGSGRGHRGPEQRLGGAREPLPRHRPARVHRAARGAVRPARQARRVRDGRGLAVSSLNAYDDLVHELARLDADTTAGLERARRRLTERRRSLESLRTALDEEVAALAEGCAALRRPVPDLAPAPDPEEAGGGDVDVLLRDARVRLREAGDARLATMRAAQRPTFLPRAHHVVRELLVYGGAMVACFAVQLLWLRATGGGESTWWMTFIPP